MVHDTEPVWAGFTVGDKPSPVLKASNLLGSTVTLLPDVHQPVSTVGGAVGLLGPGDVQETRPSCGQDHLLKVVGAAAAEALGTTAETNKEE